MIKYFINKIIFNIPKKKFFYEQRSMMRGYKYLKNKDKLSLLDDIKNTITSNCLNKNNNCVKIINNDIDIIYHNTVIYQYLIEQLLTQSFNRTILISIATNEKLYYPLPPIWHNMIEEFGIKINKTICTILFYFYVINKALHGVFEFLWQISRTFKSKDNNLYTKLVNYAYFEALQYTNIPNDTGYHNYGIISSYINKFPKPEPINFICHNIQNKKTININGTITTYIPSPIPPLAINKSLLSFLLKSLFYMFYSLVDIFRGNWQTPLLLREKIKSLAFRYSKIEYRAKQYLFHNSSWVYRPLWTYTAAKYGSMIDFYFYSTNCELFKINGKYPDKMTNAWAITTWQRYIVWDQQQADFIYRTVYYPRQISIVGSISFLYSNQKYETSDNRPIVAVFDVQPHRPSSYNVLGLKTEYYVPDVCNNFINDIINIASYHGYYVVIKRKRDIGNMLHIDYKNNILAYSKNTSCRFVDTSIPPEEIISKSSLVISMAFTSTALIAKMMGKASIYYDPSGIIETDDRASHGIPIIVSKQGLENYFYSQKEKKNKSV